MTMNESTIKGKADRKSMEKLEYTVRFITPAFLGNAEQHAQWRTPPFKTLLRHWWRVVWWNTRQQPSIAQMRKDEGMLFGAAVDKEASRSALRLRLKNCNWGQGTLKDWGEPLSKVTHPEVKFPVGSDLYLGYGPLTSQKGIGTKLKDNHNAIAAEKESAELWLGFPETYRDELEQTVALAAWFGTLGSRSRNGWGSLQVDDFELLVKDDLLPFAQPLARCLQQDWPHAVGMDDKRMLVWTTEKKDTWQEIIKELAEIKIAFRTHFKFTKNGFNDRHVLAYPVTKHNVPQWDKQTGRLGNQIRFKVIKSDDKYFGLIVHLPCRIPDVLEQLSTQSTQQHIWEEVHQLLDDQPGVSRLE